MTDPRPAPAAPGGEPRRVAALSVAVATLDRPDALARCVDALLAGDVLPAEVLVIDQSANDATAVVLSQRPPAPVPVVHVRQARRGLSASRNAGAAHASGPIVAFTDDDCVPDRGWVAAVERAFADGSAPDAVTGRVLPLGPEEAGTFSISARSGSGRADYAGRTIPWRVGTGGNFAARREWLARVGGYDERLGAGSPGKAGEDMDLFYRLLKAGARLRYEPDAVVYHERQTRERRLATRRSYAHGIGAACAIWLRGGDAYAAVVIAHWLAHVGKASARALLARDWGMLRQRALSVRGTLSGLAHGWRAARRGGPEHARE